ncbi:MAG: uracil phosphoribosyltransferase [Candidatus Marinimicrobia bacterium]|nr:uracil phosphoribosyltransferase [Candidatus Neomarinimicrobiota bacterium]
MANELTLLDHPLVRHHLGVVRDRRTPPAVFRQTVYSLTTLLAYEATQDLRTAPCDIVTPIAPARVERLAGRIAVVPILRAGLGMTPAIMDLLPEAEIWHLGFYRDDATLQPVEYYKKLPPGNPADVGLIIDPMLATGGSCLAAIAALRHWGVPRLKLCALLAAPEGIARVQVAAPDTQIYVCAVDERLNENAYIVPGLGDAGDRLSNAVAH